MTYSRASAQIVAYLAGNPPEDQTSGAAIAKATGLDSSALYRSLVSLEFDGHLTSRWVDEPYPRRRLYTLTPAGRTRLGQMPDPGAATAPAAGNWFWRTFVAPLFGG